MKIKQTVQIVGDNVVQVLTEEPSGKVLARRVWQGAGKYATMRGDTLHIDIPVQAGINIKPGA